MKRVRRVDLPPTAKDFLEKRTATISAAADPKSEAQRLWKQNGNTTYKPHVDAIKNALHHMASGIERCMYCCDSHGTDIEHFWPKSKHPHRAFVWENYLLACSHCNSNEKRTKFPQDAAGNPLLIDPSADDPLEHLVLSPDTGEYRAITQKGEKSRDVFGLNRYVLTAGRQDAWVALCSLLTDYATHCDAKNSADALKCQRAICRHPYADVFAALLHFLNVPELATILNVHNQQKLRDMAAIVERFPHIREWAECNPR